MKNCRLNWTLSILRIRLLITGCAGSPADTATAPAGETAVSAPVAEAAATTPVPVVDSNILYQDDFTNPASGWPEEKFDNYFIGYHEPEYYHVEITSPSYKTTVFEPEKQSFGDASIETKVFTNSKKTSETGDFTYGVAFRRSGDQYYAFTISPRSQKWSVLKSTSTSLDVLAEGSETGINALDVEDVLRVDAQGSNFALYINNKLVGQTSDSDYASGEAGFFVQTLDAANIHIHFDTLVIQKLKAPQPLASSLYQDDFTNPASGWPEEKFDNYFIGYHEPEYYHVEITSPNYKTTVFEPEKKNFSDASVETKVFTNSKKTSETGDFDYGVAFRRSGDQYYAFAISPRTKQWQVLKSSSTSLTALAEGTEAGINALDVEDTLRVESQGSSFSFYINDKLVGQVTDADYASGDIGFFVQTLDATNVHIHFDSLNIQNIEKTQAPEPEAALLYQDVFTNPASGWAEKKFDNYFVGYHEPEYYHVEITSPNYKTTIFEPEKQSFSDASVISKVFTNSKKTSETGDFSYGVAFHRSGDQYYAFTISPRSKKWFVLKSSSTALTVLAEGTEAGINPLDVEDVLRVDIYGSSFSFYINGKLVGQVTDADYTSGEVGFYVQTLDAANVHIHFDELTIREFKPVLVCNVKARALNVRSGPGTNFGSFTVLKKDNTFTPTGRSADGKWLKLTLDGTNDQGWVSTLTENITCVGAIASLPVATP